MEQMDEAAGSAYLLKEPFETAEMMAMRYAPGTEMLGPPAMGDYLLASETMAGFEAPQSATGQGEVSSGYFGEQQSHMGGTGGNYLSEYPPPPAGMMMAQGDPCWDSPLLQDSHPQMLMVHDLPSPQFQDELCLYPPQANHLQVSMASPLASATIPTPTSNDVSLPLHHDSFPDMTLKPSAKLHPLNIDFSSFSSSHNALASPYHPSPNSHHAAMHHSLYSPGIYSPMLETPNQVAHFYQHPPAALGHHHPSLSHQARLMAEDQASSGLGLADPSRKFVCTHPGCNKTFPRSYNLKSHMLCHTGQKPHVCDKCQAAFARKHDLQRHTRTLHSGDRPFECPRCKQGFNRLDALKRHLLNEEKGHISPSILDYYVNPRHQATPPASLPTTPTNLNYPSLANSSAFAPSMIHATPSADTSVPQATTAAVFTA